MSGSGVTDLTLSFNKLANMLNTKIILINRPGYGKSSDTSKKADIDFIVDYYHNTLKKLNIADKYILMPHSISGIYAMYWKEKYPLEVDAIIGLDIGSINLYLENDNNNTSNHLSFIGSKLGLHRFIYNKDNSAIKNYNIYNEDYFKAIWNMNMINPYSRFNLSEENLLFKNALKAQKSSSANYYNMKKLFIVADNISGYFYQEYEKDNLLKYYKTNTKVDEYIKSIKQFQEKEKNNLQMDANTKITFVSGPHAIYYYPTKSLSDIINDFLGSYNFERQS